MLNICHDVVCVGGASRGRQQFRDLIKKRSTSENEVDIYGERSRQRVKCNVEKDESEFLCMSLPINSLILLLYKMCTEEPSRGRQQYLELYGDGLDPREYHSSDDNLSSQCDSDVDEESTEEHDNEVNE